MEGHHWLLKVSLDVGYGGLSPAAPALWHCKGWVPVSCSSSISHFSKQGSLITSFTTGITGSVYEKGGYLVE
jgi:hypothetical protein